MTGRMGRDGVSVIMAAFLITVLAAMGTAVAYMTRDAQSGAVDFFKSVSSFYAAQSGLEWARQTASGYTTADRDGWLALNGAAMSFGPEGASSFVIGIDYADVDGDPSTDDTVTVTSTGTAGGGGARTVRMTVTVPAGGAGGELFSDHFDQPDSSFFDSHYTFGVTGAPHSGMTPFITAGNMDAGDTRNVFALSSEAGGTASILVMGGPDEARLYLSADGCIKWNTTQTRPNSADCVNTPGQQARKGMDVPVDDAGYQNYFIKVRARLVSGPGFGVYFRARYPDEDDPAAIDFGGLTGYVWQYDAGMGYLAPCDMFTAVAGSDGEGMLFTRRVSLGSETCGAECGIFSGLNPGASGSSAYPFFCPENRTGLEFLDGWRWVNTNWPGRWRTIYVYVYRDRARVYAGREEIIGPGGENDPEHVGAVYLSSVPGELMGGGAGIRTIAGSLIEIDYIKLYGNSDDSDPSTLPGGS